MDAFLGVDPGKGGAIAAVDPEGRLLWVQSTPMVDGKPPEYDLPGIVSLLRSGGRAYVTVERLSVLPPMIAHRGGAVGASGGGKANFARGEARGWAWMLTALGVPFQMVAPQSWQKAMLAEGGQDTGQRSILAAQRLWSGYDFRRSARCRNLDDGMTDAALMAEFGRRRYQRVDEQLQAVR